MNNNLNLSKEDIENLFLKINERLKDKEVKGEIYLFGGAVICLCYNARMSTKDIDAIFRPKDLIYDIIKDIAEEENLPYDWLNDGVKGFVSDKEEIEEFEIYSNLSIYRTKIDYLLAMKCMSCRLGEDSKDISDIQFLVNKMKLENKEEVENLLLKYFPAKLISPKVSFMLETLTYEQTETWLSGL